MTEDRLPLAELLAKAGHEAASDPLPASYSDKMRHVGGVMLSDDGLLEAFARRSAIGVWHASRGCRMADAVLVKGG